MALRYDLDWMNALQQRFDTLDQNVHGFISFNDPAWVRVFQ